MTSGCCEPASGSRDKLVPIEDRYILSQRGVVQEGWVYQGDGHCALGSASDWAPKAALWLKANL